MKTLKALKRVRLGSAKKLTKSGGGGNTEIGFQSYSFTMN